MEKKKCVKKTFLFVFFRAAATSGRVPQGLPCVRGRPRPAPHPSGGDRASCEGAAQAGHRPQPEGTLIKNETNNFFDGEKCAHGQ